MSELTRHFDKVFVVNLASRRDRHAEMAGELAKVGLSWDSPLVEHFAAVRPADDGGFRSIGAHGCFLSHLGVLERAVAAGLQSILLLEDDCNLSSDIATLLPALNAALAHTDWSLFYGGGHLHGVEPPQVIEGQAVTVVPPAQPVWLAHCVAFRGDALRHMPAHLRAVMSRPSGHADGGRMDVDGAYSWYRHQQPQVQTVIATPQIAYQRSSRTDISELSWRDRTPGVRQLFDAARKLRNLRPR